MYLNLKKANKYNIFINVIFFISLILHSENVIGIYKGLKIFLIIMLSYLFNVYSLEKRKYTLKDLLVSTGILLPQLFIQYRFYFFDGKYKVILAVFLFQNISKIIFLKLSSKEVGIILVGEESKRLKIREILKDKEHYKIVKEYNLNEEIDEDKIDTLVITDSITGINNTRKILKYKLTGTQIYDYFSFFEEVEEKVPVNSIDENWILYGKGYAILNEDLNVKIKRSLDIIYALIIGIVTLPVMLLSAIIIKLESKGPIVYKQLRVGEGNAEFTIYKFRSMKNDAEKDGAKWASVGDIRVTKFGNFMRKTRIDELPQLWNVLKGEMSFVGPRPERMVFIKDLEKQIPFYDIRHSVKPGLTGWAQVKYPYGASVEDSYEKLQYDLYYIKHQNLEFDLLILFRTIKIVLFGKGR